MKILKSMPNDTAFFERYADLVHSLTKVATIAQVVTGAAEIGILYALLYGSINDIAPSRATTLTMIAAVFCAALLQFGLKKVFPYSVRAILFKRFKGLDLAFSIAVFILTIALLGVSIFLSWHGSKDIANFAIKPPIEKNTTSQDSAKRAATIQANGLFTTDSATIETKFTGKAEALTAELMSRIATIERNAKGKQATTQRAELKTKIAQLQADKATEIQAKSDKRQADIDKATNRADQQTDDILSDNKTAKTKADDKAKSYSGYIGYFTLFCYIFFLFTYILNEIYHKGAKIDLTPIPSQRHFDPSVVALFFEAAKERLDVFFRTHIYNFSNNTKAQPLPDSYRILHTFKAKTFDEVLKVESDFEQTKIVKLPTKRHKIAASVNDTEPTKEAEKRHTIGFRKESSNDSNDTQKVENKAITKIVGGGETIGQCPNCLESFTKNHKKHTYCKDQCRIDFWQKEKGRKIHKNRTGKA